MIQIERGLLQKQPWIDFCRSQSFNFAIITDTHVEKLYGHAIQKKLSQHGLKAHLFSFPAGEKHKTRTTKEHLENQMLAQGLGRDTCLIALGGALVTDVTGFVAATYCRGIPCIYLPTTLLAMVDGSIGGKNGVNVPEGKNLLGTITQPKAIFMDLDTLQTLPAQEFTNGLVEALKHGIILDKDYFAFLKSQRSEILNHKTAVLQEVIEKSCALKLSIVQADEKENGMRRLLNFGHTIGHALETLTDYALSHSQAVALGILTESYLSMQLGHLPTAAFDNIFKVFQDYEIPIHLSHALDPAMLRHALQYDKKAVQKMPRFILIKEIGSCLPCQGDYCQSVAEASLLKSLAWLCTQTAK